jgi:hypothetical protein
MQTQLGKAPAAAAHTAQRPSAPMRAAATTGALRASAGRAPAPAFVQIPASRSAASSRANSRGAALRAALNATTAAPQVEKTSSPLNIVFVSAEVSPWSKVCCLCVVCAALARA